MGGCIPPRRVKRGALESDWNISPRPAFTPRSSGEGESGRIPRAGHRFEGPAKRKAPGGTPEEGGLRRRRGMDRKGQLGTMAEMEREYDPIHPRGGTDWRALLRKIWAPLGAAIVLIAKFSFAALKFFSIFIAVAGYALIWGWRFAIGFVLLILVHELGHFFDARRQGLHATWPTFIPFFGAFVLIKDAPLNPWRNALVSLAGP